VRRKQVESPGEQLALDARAVAASSVEFRNSARTPSCASAATWSCISAISGETTTAVPGRSSAAAGSTATCRRRSHEHQRVAARGNVLDDLALRAVEVRRAEDPAQQVERIGRAALTAEVGPRDVVDVGVAAVRRIERGGAPEFAEGLCLALLTDQDSPSE